MEHPGNWIWDLHDQNDVRSGLTAASFQFEMAMGMIKFLKLRASAPDNRKQNSNQSRLNKLP